MPDLDDSHLLKEYAEKHSEEAFAAIVSRHINKVYSVALRQTRNPLQAEEITQAVFVILARKAERLGRRVVLSGWLYQTARLASLTFLKSEIRRARREQEAHVQSPLNESADETWMEIAPLLDSAMASLNEIDRHAVVLRYFDGKSMREVGDALGSTEDTAKKRVSRALEKLKSFFTRHGVHSTTAIIAGAISSNSVQIAPPALAQSVTAAAIAKGATAGSSTLTLTKGALKVMAWTKATTTAAVIGAGIVLTAGTALTVSEIREHTRYSWQVPDVRLPMIRKFPPQITIVPTIFSQPSYCSDLTKGGGAIGICASVTDLVQIADGPDMYRMVFEPDLPTNRYDFLARGEDTDWGDKWRTALQDKLKSKLGVVVKPETRDTDVLLLEYANPNAGGLRPRGSLIRSMGLSPRMRQMNGTNSLTCFVSPISSLQGFLQAVLEIPVIDQTGLKGYYDFKLTYDTDRNRYQASIKQAAYDQLGFELVPTNMPYPMLLVEKAE